MTWLLVALGGAVGALLRYLTDRLVTSWAGRAFPWGILTVNAVGSLVLGVVLATGSPALRALLGTGLCGALTTYSSFGYDTLRLAEQGSPAGAALNIAANLTAGLTGAAGGWILGTRF